MIVEFLFFLFVCLLEWICKVWFLLWLTTWWMFKITAWLITIPVWDTVVLGFHIVACVLCNIFKKQTPRLRWTKRLTLYSTWQ